MFGAALVLLFAGLTVFGPNGLRDLLHLRREQHRLESMIVDQSARNDELREQIVRLQNDDRYSERIARLRLGLVKDGEIVYRFGDGSGPTTR